MGLIDAHIKKLIHITTQIPENDIYNIYQLKGALPEKLEKDDTGKKVLKPYTQQDFYVLFGVEEADSGKEAVIITDQSGAPENTIIATHKFNVKVLFRGKDSDFFSIKFKARLYSKQAQQYLEDSSIDILTQNPKISFETEEVAGEFWDGRGIQFEAVIELHFEDNDSSEAIDNGSNLKHIII
jgi:hypothetical protein